MKEQVQGTEGSALGSRNNRQALSASVAQAERGRQDIHPPSLSAPTICPRSRLGANGVSGIHSTAEGAPLATVVSGPGVQTTPMAPFGRCFRAPTTFYSFSHHITAAPLIAPSAPSAPASDSQPSKSLSPAVDELPDTLCHRIGRLPLRSPAPAPSCWLASPTLMLEGGMKPVRKGLDADYITVAYGS